MIQIGRGATGVHREGDFFDDEQDLMHPPFFLSRNFIDARAPSIARAQRMQGTKVVLGA